MRAKLVLLFLTFLALNAFAKEKLTLESPDLPAGKPWPEQFIGHDWGCTGPNLSPALAWKNAPAGTKSFAVTVFDTYTPPPSGWWHWIVYNIPASTHSLARNAGALGGKNLPGGAKMGPPDGETPELRYYGPCPDKGDKPHHYVITVYALSVDHLDFKDTATGTWMAYTILGKTLGQASLERAYSR